MCAQEERGVTHARNVHESAALGAEHGIETRSHARVTV